MSLSVAGGLTWQQQRLTKTPPGAVPSGAEGSEAGATADLVQDKPVV